MDYGQTNQINGTKKEDAFFTPGVGVYSENQNTFEAENNLDLSNQSWGKSSERDPRAIGSDALRSSHEESLPKNPEDQLSELGTIVELEMPPGVEHTISADAANNKDVAEQELTKQDFISGDRISSKGLDIIKEKERKLANDGDITEFYDFVKKAREKVMEDGVAA